MKSINKYLMVLLAVLFSISSMAQPPWTVSIYPGSTTALGIVTIDGVPASAGDYVGAFVGTECRGMSQVIINAGQAYVSLVINGTQPETISFKIWDESAGTVLEVTYTVTSIPGGSIGSFPNDLMPIAATSQIPLALSLSGTNIECHGNATGNVDLTITGGGTPYSFTWSNGETIEDVDSLSANWYVITVSDVNGETIVDSIEIIEPPVLSIIASVIDVSVNGGSDGAINMAVSGGTMPYAFSWSNGSSSQNLINLQAGHYSTTVSDANGCSWSDSILVNEPDALSLILTTSDFNGYGVSCAGSSDGSIYLSVSGGNSPYTYSWSNGASLSYIDGLTTGWYYVTVIDFTGSTISEGIEILEPPAISIFPQVTDVFCNGTATGAIEITISGGVSPYNFSWSNGPTTEDITSVGAGAYTLYVSDANYCLAVENVIISEPPAISVSESITDVLCNGNSTGEIDLTITGGVTPYSIVWSNGSSTEDVYALSAGNYSVTITDANQCAWTGNYTVVEPPVLTISESVSNVLCYGDPTGSIDISVMGGTIPYSYQWSEGETVEDVNGLVAGSYSVFIEDANACSTSGAYLISQPQAISIIDNVTNVSCNGGNDGAIDLTLSGGNPPYYFTWSIGASTEDISALSAGTYNLMLFDDNSCSVADAFIVAESTVLMLNASTTNVSCYGELSGIVNVSVIGGVTPYSYNWSNGGTDENIFNLGAGNYLLTVMDANSCNATGFYSIYEPNPLNVSGAVTDVSTQGASDGEITVSVSGGTNPYSFTWSNGETSQSLTGLIDGIYSLDVIDVNSCQTSGSWAVGIQQTNVAPNWQFVYSGNSHTILIQNNIPVEIDNNPIQVGDYIGIFYDSLGTLVCAGYSEWTGANLGLTAWGNDSSASAPVGFAPGEIFKWKIWSASNGIEYDATAIYILPPVMPNTDSYAVNGISGLTSLIATTIEYQYVDLPQGWFIFSTYIDPSEPNIDSLCSDIVNEVLIIKNGIGQIYWPQWNLNLIGDIDIGQGYQSKMASAQVLEIAGAIVQPEITPLAFPQGWSIIGYLRQSSASIIDMLSPIASEIVLVKNSYGLIYWPQWGINTIGNMNPGEGYQIKMNSAQTFTYPANTLSFSKVDIMQLEPRYFGQTKNTGNNMTLGIPLSAWDVLPVKGDELGVFGASGNLVGSAVFGGTNMAITLWGNDELSNNVEGLQPGEEFEIRNWSQVKGEEHNVIVRDWTKGEGTYEVNKIAIVSKLTTLTTELETFILFQNTPNPFSSTTEFSFFLPTSTMVEFTITNVVGEVVDRITNMEIIAGKHTVQYQTKKLESGTYYYTLRTPEYSATKRMVVIR